MKSWLTAMVMLTLGPLCGAAEILIEGSVSDSESCKQDKMVHVFVSAEKTLIYHNDVPRGGTFQFRFAS